MQETITGSKLAFGLLSEKVKSINKDLNVVDFFNFLRVKYIEETYSRPLYKLASVVGCEFPSIEKLSRTDLLDFEYLRESEKFFWKDVKFHLKNSLSSFDDLMSIFSRTNNQEEIRKVLLNGFKMSILPLNLCLPKEILAKHFPVADYFVPYPTSRNDPYGIFGKDSKLVDEKGIYLGSKKFPHTVLMNAVTFCPIGCVGCYKSYYTREQNDLGINSGTVLLQTKKLVEWLNKHKEVYDVIVSGGEPLLLNNNKIKLMLDLFKESESLQVIRICTGTIFLGLPFRIDLELLQIFEDFCNETGKRITFNTHIANHLNFSPEALLAVQKIKKKGFAMYSQTPIQEGINFFKEDEQKTIQFWEELGRRKLVSGVEAYKFIVDMHPRSNKKYIPIESLIKVWSKVADGHYLPELQRPKTLSVLYEKGNIILSGHSLFAMKKKIDKEKGIVTYIIPEIFSGNQENPVIEKIYTYNEPLMPENSDPNSLNKIRNLFKKNVLLASKKVE